MSVGLEHVGWQVEGLARAAMAWSTRVAAYTGTRVGRVA